MTSIRVARRRCSIVWTATQTSADAAFCTSSSEDCTGWALLRARERSDSLARYSTLIRGRIRHMWIACAVRRLWNQNNQGGCEHGRRDAEKGDNAPFNRYRLFLGEPLRRQVPRRARGARRSRRRKGGSSKGELLDHRDDPRLPSYPPGGRP